MLRAVVACSIALAAGCASPAPYEPLVCDPAAADRVVFGFQESGAFFGPPATLAHGQRFLVIDGSCRYFVASGRDAVDGKVSSGTLSPAQLEAINAELLTGPWEAIDGEHRFDDFGTDMATLSLWRDGLGASCYASCRPAASEPLLATLDAAIDWQERLQASATPLDGPLLLLVRPSSLTSLGGAVEWTGSTSIAAVLRSAYYGTMLVSDPSDVATLRAIRDEADSYRGTILLREGEVYLDVLILDDMPHVDGGGNLRPPFPIHT